MQLCHFVTDQNLITQPFVDNFQRNPSKNMQVGINKNGSLSPVGIFIPFDGTND